MNFVVEAKLPIDSKIIIIGEKYSHKLEYSLKKLGISAIFVPENPHVDPRLNGHADLSVFHAGGEGMFLAPYLRGSAFSEEISSLGAEIRYASIDQSSAYPADAQMNACAVGKKLLIYSEKITAKEIVEYFTIKGGAGKCLSVKQGYVNCSTCVVDANSIITSDRGISVRVRALGLDVLEISGGKIDLPGFDYGFIGGAAFKISEKIMAFTGVLDGHPDAKQILDFLERRNINPVFLTDETLFDIGGALPIIEKAP